ncbi:hypothetical protein CHUAL_006810 [Chamberlinius hualienensis]
MDLSCTEDTTSQSSDESLVLIRINVPELGVQKCMQFHKEELVWDVKQQVLAALPKEMKESFNYGLYCPPLNGKAGKFLDEERPLSDYPFTGPIGYLELKYKKRVYKTVNFDEKQIKQLHTKTNLKRLMEYIQNAQAEKIIKLVNKGLDPNFHCLETGETPLTVAAIQKKCQKTILALANGGALLDFRTRDGITALHRAVEKNNLEAIKTMLDLGASPNYKDNKGLTPLYYSIINNADPHVCELLLHDHAAIGAADHQGWQEVHQSCRNGMVQHLEHLLFYGADINARNASGNTPLHVCAVNEQESCARVLLFRGADKESLNYANQTPYQVAVIAGDLGLAEVIQNHKPEDVVPFRETPKYNPRRRASIVSTTYNLSRTHSDPRLESVISQTKIPPSPSPSNRSLPPISSTSSSLSDTAAAPGQTPTTAQHHMQQDQNDAANDDTSDSIGLHNDGYVTSPAGADLNNTCTSGGYDTFPERPAPLQMPLSPGLTCVCLENYQPNEEGHLILVQGDIIEVTGSTDCGLLEGILKRQKGLFPATCVQEVKLRHPENRVVNRRQSIRRDSGSKPPHQQTTVVATPSTNISKSGIGEFRTVALRKGKKGFGFVLRGAKATSPLMEALPLENWPALQYLDEVDKGGVADLAGLQKGDFLLAINGEDVSQTSHENVVNLIRKSGESVTMTVMSASSAILEGSYCLVSTASTTPETPTERADDGSGSGGPDSPGLNQVGTPRQCATLPRKVSRGKPAPAPPRRDPRTTLSVGRARARSMVAGLAEIEALDRTLVEYDSEGRSTKSSSIESLPNKQIVAEHSQPQQTSNKSVNHQQQQSVTSKTEMKSFCLQQSQSNEQPTGSPKVYNSVSQMKRSKLKPNKERYVIHKSFHSNPELANDIVAIVSARDKSPSTRRSHSQEDVANFRRTRFYDDFSFKSDYAGQHDGQVVENGHPPPPTHPPPPPPVGQVVKVDVSRSRADKIPSNVPQSSNHYQSSFTGVMSSFRPGDSAKLYASPQDIGIIGYRQMSPQLPPPTTNAPQPPSTSTNTSQQTHHKPVSTTAIRSRSLPANIQPPPKTSSPSSSASSESEISGESAAGGGYACTTFKQPTAMSPNEYQFQKHYTAHAATDPNKKGKEYAQPYVMPKQPIKLEDDMELEQQPYIPEPDYDLSDGENAEVDEGGAPPIQPPPPPSGGEAKKKPPTPPVKRKDSTNRGSGATTIIMIGGGANGGSAADQNGGNVGVQKPHKVSPPPPAKPSKNHTQPPPTQKAPPPVVAKTVRGPPATVTPIKTDPETADLKLIIAQKAAARQCRAQGSENFVTLSTHFTEEEPVSVPSKPHPNQQIPPDITLPANPDIVVNVKEQISVFEKKTYVGDAPATVAVTSRTSPIAIRRTTEDNNWKSLKGSHSQVFEGQNNVSNDEKTAAYVKMSKSYPQKLNDEQHSDKTNVKSEDDSVCVSNTNVKGPPSPPKSRQQSLGIQKLNETKTNVEQGDQSDISDESDDDADAQSLKAKISLSDPVDVIESSMSNRRILNRNIVESISKFPPPIETGETDVESDTAEVTPTELKQTFDSDYFPSAKAAQAEPPMANKTSQENANLNGTAKIGTQPPNLNLAFVPPPPEFITMKKMASQSQQQPLSQQQQPPPHLPSQQQQHFPSHHHHHQPPQHHHYPQQLPSHHQPIESYGMKPSDVTRHKATELQVETSTPPLPQPPAPVEIGTIAPPPEFSDDIHIPIDEILDEDLAEEEARNAAAALAAAAGGLHLTCPSFVERTTVTSSSISSSLSGRIPSSSRTKGYTMPHGQINPLTLLHSHHMHHPSAMSVSPQSQLHHMHPHHQYLLQQQHHMHQHQLLNLGVGSSATVGRVPQSMQLSSTSSSIATRSASSGLSSNSNRAVMSTTAAASAAVKSNRMPTQNTPPPPSSMSISNGVMASAREEIYDLPYHYQQQLQLRQQQQMMQMNKAKLNMNGASSMSSSSSSMTSHEPQSVAGQFKDFHSKPMVQWSVKDVSDWLESLFLPEYKARFEAAGIDGRTLCYLDNNSLVELGVKKVGHRINMERSMRRHAMMK